MTNINLFAKLNLEKHLADLRLIEKIKTALSERIDPISKGIVMNIKAGAPARRILSEMQMMAEDSFNGVVKMVGKDAATEILNYK